MYILLHKKIKGKTYSIRHYIGFPNLSLENQALMGFHEATTGSRVRKLGQQRQEAGGGALIDQQTEKLQRGGIDPVQIFHHKEHRLLGGNAQ